MELSLFLARAWGLGIVIICLGILINRKKFLSLLAKLQPSELILAGMLVLGIGIAQVSGFEQWEWNWKGLITLLGWASLIKGVLLFFVPGYSDKFVKTAVKENMYNIFLVIGLVIGLYLLYIGYISY